MRFTSLLPFGAAALALMVGDAAPARAEAPRDPALTSLLERLATHAARFERMKTTSSFTLTGHMDELDRDGRASTTKDLILRVTPHSPTPTTDLVRYTENGEDKTEEERAKARDRKKSGSKKKRDFHLPFLASEQSRYAFSIVERDPNEPTHVRIAFSPYVAAEDVYRGTAWVDEASGETLSIGFSLTKNPSFVDHVDATLSFALPTPLGRAPSKLTFDATGGFLFVKKHYRGWAAISNANVNLNVAGP